MKKPRFVLSILLALSGTLGSTPAHAFCRATTCGATSAADICSAGENGCTVEGVPLGWATGSLVNVAIDVGSIDDDRSPELLAAVEAAVDSWNEATCGDGEAPTVKLTMASAESEPDEVSIWIEWIDDDWEHGPSAVGRTILEFGQESGQLKSARVLLNAQDFALRVDPQADEIDLLAVLTHEMGHALGLAHSATEGATMEAESSSRWASNLNSLEQDDVDGICSLYPPATSGIEFDLSDSVEPEGPTDEDDPGVSCTWVRPRGENRAWLALGLALFAMMIRRLAPR